MHRPPKQDDKTGKSRKGLFGVRLHQFLSFSRFFDKNASFGGEWMFFPGCSMIAHSPELVMSTFKYLRGVWPDIGLSGGCCAHPALALGKERFLKCQRTLERDFLKAGVRGVIVCCPNCAVTLKRISCLKIISIWQVLREHLPEPRTRRVELPSLVLHDPCPARSDLKLHEAVREVLSRLGLAFEEYPANRDKTLCCGRANMLMVLNPEAGWEMLRRRIEQSSCRDVVTYCFSCVDAFKSAGCRGLHGLDYVFSPDENIDLSRREGWAQSWRNRWVMARHINALDGGCRS
jgi:Fe-S oxidoreductase